RSILVGLIVNELVSNAGKYAYPDGSGGLIQVRAVLQTDRHSILISVRDEGVGLPADFNPETSKRLGTRMVNAFKATGWRGDAPEGCHRSQIHAGYSARRFCDLQMN